MNHSERKRMVVLYFLPLVFVLLVPQEILYQAFSKIVEKLRKESSLTRGEHLLEWLDSFGLVGDGFDLGAALPERNSYKCYGVFIHIAWKEVRLKGGELGPYFRIIKSLLREELKREREENEAYNLARVQVISILVLVWVFLFFLSQVAQEALTFKVLFLIFCWQIVGLGVGVIAIKRLKRKFFGATSVLLELLLKLYSFRFSGNLTEASLAFVKVNDRAAHLIFKRMQNLLIKWRKCGTSGTQPLDDLLEDIIALSQLRGEKFKKVTPGFFFIWCSIFVLPVLFFTTLISVGL